MSLEPRMCEHGVVEGVCCPLPLASRPTARCSTTHHMGCACWEARRDAELSAARWQTFVAWSLAFGLVADFFVYKAPSATVMRRAHAKEARNRRMREVMALAVKAARRERDDARAENERLRRELAELREDLRR